MNKTLKPGWSYKKLNELGFVGRGKSKHRPRNEPSLYGGKHPFIQTAEVTASEFYIIKYSQTYSDLGLAQSKLWDKNTLCIVNAGENTAETAILKFQACFPDSIIGFIADSEKADVRFIKYYLTTIKPQLRSITKGATQDNLSVSKLLLFDILTPPLPIQRKIAGILSAYDDLIENNTRRIEILEEMARSIYREWFVKFRFPGHEQVQMVDSELGLIPEGWEVKNLGNLTSVITKGTTPTTLGQKYTSEGINFIKVESIDSSGSILDNKLAKIDKETHILLKRSQLNTGDILFSIAGAIGRSTIISENVLPANTNQALAIIRPIEPLLVLYLYRVIQSREFVNFSLGRVVQTAQANVSLSVLSAAPILVPDKLTLEKFRDISQPIVKAVDLVQQKNLNLRQTRDLLLPRLISGEMDVENLDINTGEIAA